MDDVFGGLAGGTGEPHEPHEGPRVDPAALEPALDDARMWGVELDTRYRVLAATVEPTPERFPWGAVDDRRIQLLCHPVSTILASLRRESGDEKAVLEFDDQQLLDVVSAFEGARLSTPVFGLPEPRPGSWGPTFSMQGRSSAPDGVTTTLTLAVRHEDLALDLFARFDELQVQDAAGEWLTLPST